MIIYKVKESTPPDEKDAEKPYIDSILENFNMSFYNVSRKRIGKINQDGTSRPLFITLFLADDVFYIFKYKDKLTAGLSVFSDKTKKQQEQLKKIHQEADRFN